ncbi:MAG: hypothetical protein Q7R83_01070 [bacterium]|nr:hypothetical protein [bacterium]
MKNIFILVGALAFFGAGCSTPISPPSGRACTLEAKICPDGSAVGRTGPNCEFSVCPTSATSTSITGTGTFVGTMTIGPICPVERVDQPCLPTPEMFAAHKVFIYNVDRSKLITTLIPDAKGNFTTVLPEGAYTVDVVHQAVGFVRGAPSTVTIISGETVTISMDIDTGIR